MLRLILSFILIACLLVSVSAPLSAASGNSNDREPFISLPMALSIGFMTGAFIVSPYEEMVREIHTLKEDQSFIRRHLLINHDPSFREHSFSVLEISRTKQRQVKKKLRSFSYWFIPSVVVASTGVFMLSEWALD